MSYLALYRKYRSNTFDELVGQKPVIQTLENALKNNKIAHAYLFSGPRGTGKTSIARLFAKALNCEEGIGHQCNTCENCVQIGEGIHPDVIEIDAASNSGVDEVRNLIDQVKYAPIKGRYKVYIIDEVHMMSNNAFNALLKTLEEPPSYVVFILCTTEPYKVLPTILSRCQRYEFHKIDDSDLKTLLNRVLKEEKITVDEGVVDLLVEIANGGARDALSLLDQLIAYSGNHIAVQDIKNVFGLTSNEEKLNLLKQISLSHVNEILNIINEYANRNVDINRLTSELLYLLKDALIYGKTSNADLLEVSKENTAKTIISLFNTQQINDFIDSLIQCTNEFKTTSNPRFLFEIYMLKAAEKFNQNKVHLEDKITKEKGLTKDIEEKHIAPIATKSEIKVEKITEQKQEEETQVLKNEPLVQPKPELKINKPHNAKFNKLLIEGDSIKVDEDTIIDLMVLTNLKRDIRKNLIASWDKLDNFITIENAQYVAILKDGKPFAVTKKHLVLLYDFKTPATKVNIKENQVILKEIIKKLTGFDYQIYAIDRSESTHATSKFYGLQQLGTLPTDINVDDINLD